MDYLTELGWDTFFQDAFRRLSRFDLLPARIISQQKNSYRIMTQNAELVAVIAGKMYQHGQTEDFPAVGDWVTIQPPARGEIALIEALLPRKSQFSRSAAGGRDRRSGGAPDQQIIAANIDVLFIVSALDSGRGLNLRRLERYLTLSWNSGASPVLILNKADLCQSIEVMINKVYEIARGAPVVPVSVWLNQGLDVIHKQIGKGHTAAFIGPSGVGKSSIINSLLGEERIKVNTVRESDSAGHHTTSHRELFLLPQGGAVIDTPGLREIQLWSDQDALNETFDDIEGLAEQCRFKNCSHNAEPGCAVQQALESGSLDPGRYNNFLKMQKELYYLNVRQNNRVRLEEKIRWRKISQYQKQIKKLRG